MEQCTIQDFKGLFSELKQMALENRDHLIELDSAMGDGDLGLTMAAVFTAADEFAAAFGDEDIGTLCMKAGMAMAKAAPSTMGTLMATGFMRGGKALKGTTVFAAQDAAAFLTAFVEGIMDRGKAKPGEKTIIDALYPAAEAAQAAAGAGEALPAVLRAADAAAQQGLEATLDMVAQHGRAAYYQEKSRTIQDPGATIGRLVVGVLSDYVNREV